MEELPELNVGVVGHIDHGKTTLLGKLTGKFTDTHSEELKRGITIKLGYADIVIYKTNEGYTNKESKDAKPIRYVSFIDAPGHEMLMATMLSGAALIDAAILVIAANEGIKPQTEEHLMALQARGIKNIIIVQNKIDLVTKEKAIENYKEIKEFVKGTIAENSPIIPVSAQQGINIDKILEALVNIEIPERDLESDPFFIIARSFDINKPGTEINNLKGGVLGGVLKKGILKEGDEIEIKPGLVFKKANQIIYQTLTTKIKSIHKGKERRKEAKPGASLSIETTLDPSLTKSDSLSGCVVSIKGRLPEMKNEISLDVKLFERVFGTDEHENVEDINLNEMLMLSVNTTITVGIVKSKRSNKITLELKTPVVYLKGDSVGISRRIKNHWRLIGYGTVCE